MTSFQNAEGQRIASFLDRVGVTRYRVGALAVLFQYLGKTHCVSTERETAILLYNLHHGEAMDTLRAARAA